MTVAYVTLGLISLIIFVGLCLKILETQTKKCANCNTVMIKEEFDANVPADFYVCPNCGNRS